MIKLKVARPSHVFITVSGALLLTFLQLAARVLSSPALGLPSFLGAGGANVATHWDESWQQFQIGAAGRAWLTPWCGPSSLDLDLTLRSQNFCSPNVGYRADESGNPVVGFSLWGGIGGSPMSSSNASHNYAVGLHDISNALIASGYTSLDKQAKALGLNRSTAWTIVKTKHKLGRLNTKTTARILVNPDTPACVRTMVQQYIAERLDSFPT